MKTIASFSLLLGLTITGAQAQAFAWVQLFPIFAHLESASEEGFADRLSQEEMELDLTTFPNPSRDWLVVSCATDLEQIALFDAMGNLLFSIRSGRTVQKLDISAFPSGTYWVRVTSSERKAAFKQVKKL